VRRGRHLEPFTDQCGLPASQRGSRDANQGELCFVPSPGIGHSSREGSFYVDVLHCISTQVIGELNDRYSVTGVQYLDSDDVGQGNSYSTQPIEGYSLEGYHEGTPKEGPIGIPAPPLRWS